MSIIAHQETDPTGLRLVVVHDDHPLNPRLEFDNLCRMVCWHRRYQLGDPHDFAEPADFQRAMHGERHLELPLYLYDHSGLTIANTPFSCPWDSGQVGWIAVERAPLLAAFDRKRLSPKLRRATFDLMRSEVKVYDQYLRGDVWDVRIVEEDGHTLDACSGFYGQDCAMLEGTRMLAERAADRREAFAHAFAEEVQASRPDLAPEGEASP